MYRLLISATVLPLHLLTGCQPAATEAPANLTEAQAIYAEAIEIHDEVMPRMGELMQLRQAVESKVDSLNQLDSTAYADTVQYMQHIIDNLRYADRGMMQWMRNVKKVPGLEEVESAYQSDMELEVVDTTNIVQVQKSQKEAIETVKQQIESSIQEARSILESSQ
jgi:hypothetical protein